MYHECFIFIKKKNQEYSMGIIKTKYTDIITNANDSKYYLLSAIQDSFLIRYYINT